MSQAQVLAENINFYGDYYSKPRWWFKFRYDTQVKAGSALYALKKAQVGTKNISVLEIGFGSGELLFRFDTSCSVFGLEISKYANSKADKEASRKGYREYGFDFPGKDEHMIPFGDKKFDLVIASHVLEHIDQESIFIKSIKSRLNQKGKVLILVPINERYPDPKHVRHYTRSSCEKAFTDQGFHALESFENEFLFYLVEKLYLENPEEKMGFMSNIKRLLFNFVFSRFPFFMFRFADYCFRNFTSYKPRQVVCLFELN